MSADDIRRETTEADGARGGWLRPILLMAAPLAVAWWVAFAVTGLLWWRASPDVPQVPPPDPPQMETIDAEHIDLERYIRAHPYWMPQ